MTTTQGLYQRQFYDPLIKKNMKDPSSFKRGDIAKLKGSDDVLIAQYRGTNSFGGVITEGYKIKMAYADGKCTSTFAGEF